MKNYQVTRLNYSEYQAKNYPEIEMAAIENLGLTYSSIAEKSDLNRPQILISNSHTNFSNISQELIERTELLIHPNSGYDNINQTFIERNSFPIILGNPIRAQAVATYIISQLMERYNSLTHGPTWQKGRKWNRRSMKTLKVLLIGLGHIGKIVRQVIQPIVAEVISYDPYIDASDQKTTLLEKAKDIDVLIPICGLNKTSREIIHKEVLASLAPDFTLINGARGQLIKQQDLIEILCEQPDAFAYLDVFEKEPFHAKDFEGLHNIKLSSHVAGVQNELDQSILQFNLEVTKNFKTMNISSFEEYYSSLLLKNRIIDGQLI